jgi:ribosomal protein S18 acetylase RimI-like enzyme
MASIRLAKEDDAPAIASLLAAFRTWFGRDEPSEESLARSVRRLLADPDTEYLVAGDPPVGVCQLRYRYGVWFEAEDCCLEDLYVRGEARGQGLGRALAEAALERARERGCARIELDVNEANPPALKLYRSLGFESRPAWAEGNNLLMRRRL